MILYAYVCVCAFSLYQESPDRILGDKPLLFRGGVCHISGPYRPGHGRYLPLMVRWQPE
jgi:hypothetical protein